MAKYSRRGRLTQQEQETIIISFCKALVAIKTPEEAAHFLKDLLSKQEAQMLAKRIEIARFLIEGYTYDEIRAGLKVSAPTISRVSQWLATSGEGYRMVMQRVKPEKYDGEKYAEELNSPVGWNKMKRRHPMYFWPELVLEEFVRNAKKQQKDRMRKILSQFDDKSELYEHLNLLLKVDFKKQKM